MTKKCCLPGCKSNYPSMLRNGARQVSTFSFPKDDTLRSKWLKAIPRKNWIPSKYSVVCCLHFPENEVIRDDIFRMPNGTVTKIPTRARLQTGAVPSIFPKRFGPEFHLNIKEETQRENYVDERLDQPLFQRTREIKSEPEFEEVIIKQETDDMQFENEKVLIKNEDEAEIDRDMVNTEFETHNIVWHGESSDVVEVAANLESTQSDPIGNPKQVLGHEDVKKFKCSDCGYRSKQKGNLRLHLLVHKDPSQLEMFQCTECSYQSKRKSHLQNHMVVHQNPTQIKIYKCTECSFESKRKDCYWRHSQIHKDQSKDRMFTCSECEYETKTRHNFRQHLVIHKDPKFRCKLCSFETRYQKTFKKHAKVHEDGSYNKTFKCDECSYEGKRLDHLRSHQQIHQNLSIHMLKCDSCSYFCKRKAVLERHQKTHQNLS